MELHHETQRDSLLARVYSATLQGWPQPVEMALMPYLPRKDELSVQDGCLLWGIRIVIPEKLQQWVLEELHTGHIGIVKMKALCRSHAWWPTINQDLEGLCASFESCQFMLAHPVEAPVHMWQYPELPWTRIHVDFAGPFQGHMCLVWWMLTQSDLRSESCPQPLLVGLLQPSGEYLPRMACQPRWYLTMDRNLSRRKCHNFCARMEYAM